MQVTIGLLGFGNVHRALAQLVLNQTLNDIDVRVMGIATHSHGIAIDANGLDLQQALQTDHFGADAPNAIEFIKQCPADIILEATWVNPQTGQPALDYVRTALESGKHVVTANKGPVVFGHRELTALAAEKNLGFFYESTVMDGMPVHSMRREALVGLDILRVRGVLNSTTNYILTKMGQGQSFDDALKEAQAIGIAEADPTNDVEGWDAAIKIAILANVFMGGDLRPVDVDRVGISDLQADTLLAAIAADKRVKLVCEAYRENGNIKAMVKPIELDLSDPLARLDNTASGLMIETNVLEQITLFGSDASPRTTAYGMLIDAINITRGRRG